MEHERSEISDKEAKFYKATSGAWQTSKELAAKCGISDRTARAYALKFVRLGILDLAEVFPAHRYRLSEKAGKRNASYIQRLEKTVQVFGL